MKRGIKAWEVVIVNWDHGDSASLFILPVSSLISLPKTLESKRISWNKLPSCWEEVLLSSYCQYRTPLTLFFTSVRILHGKEKKAVGKTLLLRLAGFEVCPWISLSAAAAEMSERKQWVWDPAIHFESSLPDSSYFWTFHLRTRHTENLKGKLEATLYQFHLALHREDIQNRGFCSLLDIFTLLPYF